MNPGEMDVARDTGWARPVPEAAADEEFDRGTYACPAYLRRLAAHQERAMASYARPVVWAGGTFWEVRV